MGKGGGGDFITVSVSAPRRDSLDKSGLFPEWKKMSAPKPQVEKVSFSYWLVDLCLSVFVSLSFLSQEEFKLRIEANKF